MDTLTLKERKKNFMENIINLSFSKNPNDAVLEWTIINVVEIETEKCICGNINPVYYTLINMANRNTIQVGFDCITKHMPLLKNMASLLCKQHTYQKTSKVNNKRMCFSCYKHTINKEDAIWKNICSSCYMGGTKTADPIPMLGYRMCEGCFMLNIDPNSESFKNTCNNCFKKSKIVDEDQCRACKECGVKNIALTEPAYKDKCISCFRLKPVEPESPDNRQCVQCNKFNIKPTEPDFKDKCLGCFKFNKQNEPKPTLRDCSVCLQPKLKSTDPDWKNKCTDCFMLTKDQPREYKPNNNPNPNTPMRECIVCNQLNVPANKPSFIQKCTKCYIQVPKDPLASTSGSIPDICFDMSNMDLMSTIMGKK